MQVENRYILTFMIMSLLPNYIFMGLGSKYPSIGVGLLLSCNNPFSIL